MLLLLLFCFVFLLSISTYNVIRCHYSNGDEARSNCSLKSLMPARLLSRVCTRLQATWILLYAATVLWKRKAFVWGFDMVPWLRRCCISLSCMYILGTRFCNIHTHTHKTIPTFWPTRRLMHKMWRKRCAPHVPKPPDVYIFHLRCVFSKKKILNKIILASSYHVVTASWNPISCFSHCYNTWMVYSIPCVTRPLSSSSPEASSSGYFFLLFLSASRDKSFFFLFL